MQGRGRLELTWVGKHDPRPKLEPRILLEDPALSYHAAEKVTDGDHFDNRLIFGDNLLALKALEAEFAGRVKCIFIDPPYNTGSAFTHYDDGLEHSLWLTMMRDRLELLHKLLLPEGSLWVTIDDNEAHYLKVLLDEIFGRECFVANIVWQKRYAPDARIAISDAHEHLLCYSISPREFGKSRNLLELTDAQTKQFRNPDNDPRGPWKADNYTAAGFRPNQMYEITLPSGRIVTPPAGRCWRVTREGMAKFESQNLMYYGPKGDSLPSLKRFLSDMGGMVPWSWWAHTEAGHSQEGKKESQEIFGREEAFSTPKPERLLERIIHIATNSGDLVLDTFAGSGTTGAVAHKMGRKWIMVELLDHCHTHIIPRMRKVIDGTDQGGISKALGWKGGGGFRYYKLAPSLLRQDKFGQWVINEGYNAEMLAEAMCRHTGFDYEPSPEIYWMQGRSTETDFIFTTTQHMTREALALLSEEVGEGRTLLVCCPAYDPGGTYPNLTLTKIPEAVLSRCEFGRDDYSLQIQDLPMREAEPEEPAVVDQPAERKKKPDNAPSLFGEENQP
jgi:adenine-specific DNA-methyltransferase